MSMLVLLLAMILLAGCVWFAVSAFRALGRASSARRVQVPARVLSSRDVPVGGGANGGLIDYWPYELELEYPGPDGRPLVTTIMTSHDHSLRAGGRVGPEFDGHSVWVNTADPSDVALSPSGDKSEAFRPAVVSFVLGGCGLVALIGSLVLWIVEGP